MFYSSRVLRALSELECALTHHHEEDEDAMFVMIKQCKAEGMKPMTAAAMYFMTEAERGMAVNPERWLPMVRQAAEKIELWSRQEAACRGYADKLFELLVDDEESAEADEA